MADQSITGRAINVLILSGQNKILRVFPWVSSSLNAFIYLVSYFYIIFKSLNKYRASVKPA